MQTFPHPPTHAPLMLPPPPPPPPIPPSTSRGGLGMPSPRSPNRAHTSRGIRSRQTYGDNSGLTSSSLYEPPARGSNSARASTTRGFGSASGSSSYGADRSPAKPPSLIACVLADPPLPLHAILAAGAMRLPLPALPRELPELPPLENRKPFLLRDAMQQREFLWGEFQSDVRYRLLHRNEPPPPPPPPAPPHKSSRGPKIKSKAAQLPPEPADWTGKVALALHNNMKKNQSRVRDVFKKFDTDGSDSLDASEFHAALIELGIPESLSMPNETLGQTLQEVFDTMDGDGNGVLSFKEINKYLRAGKHEVVLDAKLQDGAVKVQVGADGGQKHRTRRKEEWKALDRFDALDVAASGSVTIRELTAFFLSEGYTQEFVNQLMAVLDKDSDGSLTSEEWRAGVTALRGSSLLMSMTDPVEPPSGENFKDLRSPVEHSAFAGYPRSLKGTVLYPETDTVIKIGKTARGCTIADPENRAIRLSQLRSVCEHIRRRSASESWVNTDGEKLTDKDVTMYDCAAYVIKPATKKRKCSLVEVIAKAAQAPRWFCSHWWGQPVLEVLVCLEQHTRDRLLDLNNVTYWLSAFALSQWQLGTYVELDIDQSVFMRAMSGCEGTVSVVPKKGADYFSRIWCVYELGASLAKSEGPAVNGRGFLYDMYAPLHHKVYGELVPKDSSFEEPKEDPFGDPSKPVKEASPMCNFFTGRSPDESHKPKGASASGMTVADTGLPAGKKPPPEAQENRWAVGMTEGLVASDRDEHSKTAREEHFPADPLAGALTARLQAALASVETDRSNLLNAISGKESLDARVDTSHMAYSEINARIRGHTATTALVRAVIENGKGDPAMFNVLLEGLVESSVTSLNISFSQAVKQGVTVTPKVFEQLLASMPATIEELRIELPASVAKLPDGKLKELPKLRSLFISGSHLEKLPEDLPECYSLTTLDLVSCKALPALPKKIFDLRSLQHLNISGCNSIMNINATGIAASPLETLLIEDCIGLMNLPETVGNKFNNVKMLSVRGCFNLSAMPPWVAELEKDGAAVQRPYHLE